MSSKYQAALSRHWFNRKSRGKCVARRAKSSNQSCGLKRRSFPMSCRSLSSRYQMYQNQKFTPKYPKPVIFPWNFSKGEYQNHPKVIHRTNSVDPKCAIKCVKFAEEKVLGVPLTCFYHIFIWVCAGVIAFDPNGDRLVTDTCRQVERSGAKRRALGRLNDVFF